jgi:hypothetical protein
VLIIFASTAWIALLIFNWGKRSLRVQVPVNAPTSVVH